VPAVTPTILGEGQPMDPTYDLVSIDIRRECNRIPQAELRVLDGNAATREFPISDSGFFDPGTQIEIKVRYEGEEDATLFKGLVVRHGLEIHGHGSVLVIVVKDAAVKLAGARKSAFFEKKTDDAIIKELITDAGLEAGDLAATKPEHPGMVQYYCTAWDFILSRADAQGMLVVADDGKISLVKLEVTGEAKHTFEYGISEILDVEIEADAAVQYKGVESVAWDPKEQKRTGASKAASVALSPGDLDGEQLGGVIGKGTATLSHPVPVTPDELQAWADGTLARSRIALCRGRIAVPGFADIKPLEVMEIAGLGKHFSGKTLVTGLRHRIDSSGWRTDVQFGLSAEGFSGSEGIVDAPAAGLLPAVTGLQIGVVSDFESDPDGELRVKVALPGVDPEKALVWARLASPDAGKARGFYFRPEPKDEVVVGFLDNDPRYPIILGALYGSKNPPADAMGKPSDKNDKKGIVTKQGTTIGFIDGDKASVFIETAGKNKLLLDDDGKQISIKDQHGNSITMDKDGIVLKSIKDFKIDAADGNVEIKGSKVDVK
jgi:Rhs element Vgr protein